MQVIEHLHAWAQREPGRPAFLSDAARLTYGEAAAMAARVAGGMAARGAAPGMRAAVLSPNDPRAFCCMLGILHAGAAWVPVNARNGAAANAEFLARAECGWLFWHGAVAADAAAVRAGAPGLRHAVRIDGAAGEPDSLATLMAAGPVAPAPDDPDRICTVVGTGGTTGVPKGVAWTASTWDALLAAATAAMPCDAPPVHLCVAPMTHAAGVLAMMLMPAGPANVVLDRADPLDIMQRIEADRVTHLYLPPTLLYLMLAHPEVRRFDYSSLRCFLITAAPVAPERLREAVDVFGPVMAQCYGQSEAPMICTFFSPEEVAAAAAVGDDARLASCGRATAGTTLAVMAPDGALLPPGEVGELVVRSGLVMRGYLDDPAATADASRHGWHHTGDIGRIEADGLVYVVDRQKDMVITGGFNVYPAEIERLILSHPSVQDCAVIGVPDPKWGEAVKAVIELRPGAAATEADIIALCRAGLGSVKAPKSVEFRPGLPRSPVGKLLKRALRDKFWAGRARPI